MAIAHDTSSGTSGTGTSITWSHTCTGSNLILWVMANTSDVAANSITGVTYNSVAMTLVAAQNTTQPLTTSLWYLINPATGTNSVVVSSSSSRNLVGQAASYTGASQTGVPDASAGNAFASSTITQSVTTVADNCWLVGAFVGNRATSAGTGTTIRQGSGSSHVICDSNGAKTPAGSYSLQLTQSDGTTSAFEVASFAPAGASVAARRSLTLLGVS